MSKFKVGDRVAHELASADDEVGTVTAIGCEYDMVEVSWPEGVERNAPSMLVLVSRKDTPKVGDAVRVVLEMKVQALMLSGAIVFHDCDGDEWGIRPGADDDWCKSIEIIEKAKPSVKDLPVGSAVKDDTGSVFLKMPGGKWHEAGNLYRFSSCEIDERPWTLLVEQSNG